MSEAIKKGKYIFYDYYEAEKLNMLKEFDNERHSVGFSNYDIVRGFIDDMIFPMDILGHRHKRFTLWQFYANSQANTMYKRFVCRVETFSSYPHTYEVRIEMCNDKDMKEHDDNIKDRICNSFINAGYKIKIKGDRGRWECL